MVTLNDKTKHGYSQQPTMATLNDNDDNQPKILSNGNQPCLPLRFVFKTPSNNLFTAADAVRLFFS